MAEEDLELQTLPLGPRDAGITALHLHVWLNRVSLIKA